MSLHPTLTVIIAVATTVTVVVGGTIAYLAHRAADRRGARSLRLFSYGFVAITLGVFVGGSGALVFGFDAERTLLVQGVLVAPGFLLLLRSLYDVSARSTRV